MIKRSIRVDWLLRVFFTEDVFAPENPVLRNALADRLPRKVLVVMDDAVAQAQPQLDQKIQDYFAATGGKLQLVRTPLDVPGGEGAKNSQTLVFHLLEQLHKHHIDRQSYLVAIGGGALLDVAGFAAAIAHRGVRLVRIPTTTLSQADSGVGVKNGLNVFGQKNFAGSFAPPFAVINDASFLTTLAPEDKRDGYVEAVKVACIRDAKFFAELERNAKKLAAFEPKAMKRLIQRCARLHIDHIATSGDPFEMGSARPLDFGHWAAHKLEQLNDFKWLSHGRAVAVGIALDVVYSKKIGLLAETEAERILTLLEKLGFKLYDHWLAHTPVTPASTERVKEFARALDHVNWKQVAAGLKADPSVKPGELKIAGMKELFDHVDQPWPELPHVLRGLEEFREHLGGELTVTLLKGIGRGIEVHEMNADKIVEAIAELNSRNIRRELALKHSAHNKNHAA